MDQRLLHKWRFLPCGDVETFFAVFAIGNLPCGDVCIVFCWGEDRTNVEGDVCDEQILPKKIPRKFADLNKALFEKRTQRPHPGTEPTRRPVLDVRAVEGYWIRHPREISPPSRLQLDNEILGPGLMDSKPRERYPNQ